MVNNDDFQWMVDIPMFSLSMEHSWYIRNDLNESMEIQEYLFSLGYKWRNGVNNEYLDYPDMVYFAYDIYYGLYGSFGWASSYIESFGEFNHGYDWSEIKKFI